jgi:hypothetical protein
MHLRAKILVARSSEIVWRYLGNPSNIPKWDRGVGSVRHDPNTSPGVGFELETFGRSDGSGSEAQRGRMAYRIAEANPVDGCIVQLTNSDGNARYFKSAEWHFSVDPDPRGVWIVCAVHFKLRLRYIFFAPVLFMMRGAIYRDLRGLKEAIENG